MPKHLMLFFLFMALLVALFYHPIPDPSLWDADSRHIAMPKYPILEFEGKIVDREKEKREESYFPIATN